MSRADWLGLTLWVYLSPLVDLLKIAGDSRDVCSLLEEWHLTQDMRTCLEGFGVEPGRADATVRLITGLLSPALQGPLLLSELTGKLTADHNLGNYLQVNQYEGILWFNQESIPEADLLADGDGRAYRACAHPAVNRL